MRRKKEYRKQFSFGDLDVIVHGTYDYHNKFIGYGGCITRVLGANTVTVWSGNAWGRKSSLKNGAYLLLQQYREWQRYLNLR